MLQPGTVVQDVCSRSPILVATSSHLQVIHDLWEALFACRDRERAVQDLICKKASPWSQLLLEVTASRRNKANGCEALTRGLNRAVRDHTQVQITAPTGPYVAVFLSARDLPARHWHHIRNYESTWHRLTEVTLNKHEESS